MNSRLVALDTIAAFLKVDKTPENVAALDRKITSGRIDWPGVISLANMNFISPTLWAELRSHELDRNIPGDVRDYLDEIHRLNTVRNQRLREQTIEMVRAFNTIDVEPVLLKGAASLFVKTYQDLGSRMLTDIDILVPREKAEDCWNLLRTRGYSPLDDDGNYDAPHHHLRPLIRLGEYAVVEIHRDVLMSSSTGRLFGVSLTHEDTDRITLMVADRARYVHGEGVAMYIPDPTSRVLHCLLHSAFQELNAYRSGILPLRSIHELALLQYLFATEIDWDTISHLLSAGGKPKLLRAWVYLAHRLFGSALPSGWEATPRMRAHYARCRLQARWGLSITFLHFSRI